MRSAGMASVNPSNPELAQLLEAGAEVSAFEAAAKTAVDQGKGFGYALGIVRNQLADAARMAADVREVTAGRKRSTAPQTERFRGPASALQRSRRGRRPAPWWSPPSPAWWSMPKFGGSEHDVASQVGR